MSQAIVDPAELRRFAQNLKKFNLELEDRLTSLRAQLHSLGATWRDQEHKKFMDDFEQHMKVIAKYMEATNEHAPFLMRKADRIEDLDGAYARVAAELRNLYTVGFYPNDAKERGAWHDLAVTVNRPGYTARTRRGYYVD